MDCETLYKQARDGDNSAKAELFAFLSVRFRVLARLKIWNEQDADDIIQNTMLTISKEVDKTDIHTNFLSWAYKVFDNRVLAYIVKKKSVRNRDHSSLEDSDQRQSIPTEIDFDLKERLFKCFDRVRSRNIRYARVIALHYQGYTTEEICNKLDINTENLYMILSRARTMLKSCIETDEEIK